jgi:cysteine desulfurase
MARPIYLDHNATTPILAEVLEAMLPWLGPEFGNPSSSHAYGRPAREAVDAARAEVATLIGASPAEVVFTSGGTEANNLAILGVAARAGSRRRVLTSTIEHPATAEPCRRLAERGFRIDWAPVGQDGRLDLGAALALIGSDTALVTLMHSNNETGVLQPVAEVAAHARKSGTLVHTDAAQSAGKVPLSVDALGVDLLSIAGHKLYAPKGVGALYVRSGVELEPLLLGAGHERGLRPGTENVASIAGLGRACAIAAATLAQERARVSVLRDRLLSLLGEAIPGLAVHGHGSERLPNTLNVRFPGLSGNALLAAAPELAASTGSACHAGGETASAVLLAMGVAPEAALGSVRLTLGRGTTEAEIDQAVAALVSAFAVLRRADHDRQQRRRPT